MCGNKQDLKKVFTVLPLRKTENSNQKSFVCPKGRRQNASQIYRSRKEQLGLQKVLAHETSHHAVRLSMTAFKDSINGFRRWIGQMITILQLNDWITQSVFEMVATDFITPEFT